MRIEGEGRAGIERLIRYGARPPLVLERLHALDSSTSSESLVIYRFPKADLYVAASMVESAPAQVEAITLGWIFSSSLLMATGLLFALAGTLGWFVISHWMTHIETADQEVLGLTGPDFPTEGEA